MHKESEVQEVRSSNFGKSQEVGSLTIFGHKGMLIKEQILPQSGFQDVLKPESHESSRYDVIFGKLTKEQHDSIELNMKAQNSALARQRSEPENQSFFSSSKNYKLSDFLRPIDRLDPNATT